MIKLLLVILVVLIITFKKEIVSFFNKPVSTTKKIPKNYVITPLKVTDVNKEYSGNICEVTITFCDDRTIIVRYNHYYGRSLWNNIGRGDICSQVQKFRFGFLVSEEYFPVTPEHVCFKWFTKKPYWTIR